ncbi:MAG: hypothetical protein Q7J80_03100 [Anaerolineales bacterium]|nr:hypothetical protein [Anaerolineales bacterium]
MVYPTLRATVHNGKIQLLDEIQLPEDALILVTVMDENAMQSLTEGERLAAGLQDILLGRFVEVNTPEEISAHLDAVLGGA